MNWNKFTKHHFYSKPVEHLYTANIFRQQEYETLYENSNNFNHITWIDFYKKYKIAFEYKESLDEIDFDKEIIALWFFQERADATSPPLLSLGDKQIPYKGNHLLLTEFKGIKIVPQKRKYIRHPFIQLDVSKKQYEHVVAKFR